METEVKTQHTAEPWEYTIADKEAWISAPQEGKSIVTVPRFADPMFKLYRSEQTANLKRIVASVNACKGVSTEALERGVIEDLINTCKATIDVFTGGRFLNGYEHKALESAMSALAKLEGR